MMGANHVNLITSYFALLQERELTNFSEWSPTDAVIGSRSEETINILRGPFLYGILRL